jgi:hypothetical protein
VRFFEMTLPATAKIMEFCMISMRSMRRGGCAGRPAWLAQKTTGNHGMARTAFALARAVP